jgi:hypothetical protein
LGIKAGPDETTPLQMAKDLHRETIVMRIVAEENEQKKQLRIFQAHGKRLDDVTLYNAEFTGVQNGISVVPENTQPD